MPERQSYIERDSFCPDNPNVAKDETMAYAEKPYREMQLNLKAAGFTGHEIDGLGLMALQAAQRAELTFKYGQKFAAEGSITPVMEDSHIIRTAYRVARVLESTGETSTVWITDTDELPNQRLQQHIKDMLSISAPRDVTPVEFLPSSQRFTAYSTNLGVIFEEHTIYHDRQSSRTIFRVKKAKEETS